MAPARGVAISSAMGHIRPAGPFSFISGSVLYYALAFACLLGAHFQRDRVPAFVLWTGWGALILAAAVSGSRSLLVSLGPVAAGAGVAYLVRPQLFGAMVRTLGTAMLVISVVWASSVVQDGVQVFSARLRNTGGASVLLDRMRGTLDMSLSAWSTAPIMGEGLGLGTNAGSALLGSRLQAGRDEWTRGYSRQGRRLGLLPCCASGCLAAYKHRRGGQMGHVLPILCLVRAPQIFSPASGVKRAYRALPFGPRGCVLPPVELLPWMRFALPAQPRPPAFEFANGLVRRRGLCVSCPRASDHHVRASILHWNRPTECLATVAALRTQGVPLQLTIIDNQSSAESLRVLEAGLPADVELIRLPENVDGTTHNRCSTMVNRIVSVLWDWRP